MGGSKPQLSVGERALMIPVIIRAVADFVLALVSYPFTSQRPTGLMKACAFPAMRQWFASASLRQLQSTAETSEEAYASAAKAKNFPTNTVTLEDGTKAHWVGEPTAKKVALFFHGGGFVTWANPAHYTTLYTNVVAKSGSDTSCLVLSYDIAPGAQYPRQLQQAAMALQHLLKIRSPSTIFIVGDSAGGGLAAALLGHLAHPHPDPSIPKITLSEPLLGAILLSPWTKFEVSTTSWQRNQRLDLIPAAAAVRWSSAYLGHNKPDNYNEPSRAPSSWWNAIPVRDVLITGGEDEVLIDQIKDFARKFKDGHPATQVVWARDEAHDQMISNALVGAPPTESDGAAFAFIAAR